MKTPRRSSKSERGELPSMIHHRHSSSSSAARGSQRQAAQGKQSGPGTQSSKVRNFCRVLAL
eukprot:1321931-Pyramimonas_sp.AAC.1